MRKLAVGRVAWAHTAVRINTRTAASPAHSRDAPHSPTAANLAGNRGAGQERRPGLARLSRHFYLQRATRAAPSQALRAAPSPRRRSRSWRSPTARRRRPPSASISRIRLCAASSSTSVVVCGRQTSFTCSASPSVASSAAETSREVGVGAPDDVALLVALHVLGAGLDRRLHHLVLGPRARRIDDLPHAVEHEGDRPGLAEVPAALGEGRADVRGGAVAVVGHRLDDDGDAVRPVALVADLLVVLRVAAGGLLDRPVDVVAWASSSPAPPSPRGAGAGSCPGRGRPSSPRR